MWFLLAGHLRDAVNVCAQQLNDIQLAIAIARAYEGDGGPVLTELLEERVLPLAAFEGDRWMATWAFWMLGQRDMAVRALITPVHVLLAEHRPGSSGSSVSSSQHARSYLATDPALGVMYRQLRGRTAQTIMGATRVSPREEWAFVLHMARLYDRMGCDVLALDLGRFSDTLFRSNCFYGARTRLILLSAKLGVLEATAAGEEAPERSA